MCTPLTFHHPKTSSNRKHTKTITSSKGSHCTLLMCWGGKDFPLKTLTLHVSPPAAGKGEMTPRAEEGGGKEGRGRGLWTPGRGDGIGELSGQVGY